MNITALSQRTGVAAETLRKWEQRYAVLRPDRTPGGQRRYTELDVARVQWLLDRLAEGYRIGDAATLLGEAQPVARAPAEFRRAIYEAALRTDAGAVARLLDQAFALLPHDDALVRVVHPVLQQVGDGWAEGELSIAQEHLVSSAIRARLHRFVDGRGGDRGTAVLACVPRERHELGLLMLAGAMANDGWAIAYLGADTPLDEAVDAAAATGASILCLSVTLRDNGARLKRLAAPRRLHAVVGGPGASGAVARRLGAQYLDGNLRQVVRELRRVGR